MKAPWNTAIPRLGSGITVVSVPASWRVAGAAPAGPTGFVPSCDRVHSFHEPANHPSARVRSDGHRTGRLHGRDAVRAHRGPHPVKLDVMFVATEREVVNAMLMLAGVTRDDVVYDLGCGDGRIVIAAAKEFGARGVGVDLEDRFDTDIQSATVVMLFLAPAVNARLQPEFMTQLKPGSRIVSHRFGLGKWLPERTLTLSVRGTRDQIFLWRMP